MKNNTQDIANELRELGASLPVALNSKNPFVVPHAYFEGFADNMLLRVGLAAGNEAQEELKQLSPFLSSLKKDTAFKAPADYFATLPINIDQLKETEASEPGPKVIRMNTNRSKNVFRYAVAASVIAVLGIAAFLWRGNDKPSGATNGGYVQGLPEVPDDALAGFISATPDIHQSEFVDSSDTAFFDHALLKLGDENELENMLTGVPDNDLNDYDKDLL